MRDADVLIVGAGIAGLSAAAALAPDHRVIVLERELHPGMHATGRSAALFVENYGNAAVREMNRQSRAALTPYLSPRGVLIVAGPGEEAALEAQLTGSSMQEIGIDDAARRFPILNRDRAVRAAYEADASDIDVDRLMGDHRKALRAAGGEIVTRAEVTGLAPGWTVETTAGMFTAPIVVNAAGAWADVLAQMAGVAPLGLTPCRRSAAILPAPGGHDIDRWPMLLSAAETFYAKPEAGRLMVSPADEDPVEPMDAWPDDMVLAEGLDRYAQAVTEPVTRVERTWAGLRTFTPDRTPHVGWGADGFLWLAGQGGYGVQTSPAMAARAAGLIRDRLAHR
ncbi:NAD(P)/FAD-dependent oxidoreductase [Pontivivens ytuae]|uniref:FAD-binding oxidoreductase n=1 Tax=Pontivivens ytuae TaxID=2789856 RepID=A0A7S9QDS3_9RHOB|nr:FAD-dependent oxidoreductase [Pontivivens ytuae]QPH55190.1 FAD-binding oxidoreductase [Pontivivens ytuae]